MKARQMDQNLPPKYMGKWAHASDEEVEAEKAKAGRCSFTPG